MIISAVTREQLAHWQQIYRLYGSSLQPNRISGAALDKYFREKYQPVVTTNIAFQEVVLRNAQENDSLTDISKIVVYILNDEIYVGIDLISGFFQVECEDISKMASIWDDLFVTRGLSARDLENYVLTAQYILLSRKSNASNR